MATAIEFCFFFSSAVLVYLHWAALCVCLSGTAFGYDNCMYGTLRYPELPYHPMIQEGNGFSALQQRLQGQRDRLTPSHAKER